MWHKVRLDSDGAILSCVFVGTSKEDGATVFYVEAESAALACAEAKRRWERRRLVAADSTTRARSRGTCDDCKHRPAEPGKRRCSVCLARRKAWHRAAKERRANLGLGKGERIPREHWRVSSGGGGRKPCGPGGVRLQFRIEALKDAVAALAVVGGRGILGWLRTEIEQCEADQRKAAQGPVASGSSSPSDVGIVDSMARGAP